MAASGTIGSRDEVECDPVVPGADMRGDPTNQ